MALQTQTISPSTPAPATLVALMNADFVFNDRGQVWLLHDRPLPFAFSWAEYDAEDGTVIFVTEDGEAIPFGMAVPADQGLAAQKAGEIYVMHIDQNGQIAESTVLPIVLRDVSKV